MDYFGQDSPQTVYNSLVEMEKQILEIANQVRSDGNTAIQAKADYDTLKHQELLHLYTEESQGGIKRTEAMRQAIYRSKFSSERLAWQLADRNYQTQQEYLKSLSAVLISTQVRAKILELDRKLGG